MLEGRALRDGPATEVEHFGLDLLDLGSQRLRLRDGVLTLRSQRGDLALYLGDEPLNLFPVITTQSNVKGRFCS